MDYFHRNCVERLKMITPLHRDSYNTNYKYYTHCAWLCNKIESVACLVLFSLNLSLHILVFCGLFAKSIYS